MTDAIYKGVLSTEGQHPFLWGADGTRYLENETIWSGYLAHFRGQPVCARRLSPERLRDGPADHHHVAGHTCPAGRRLSIFISMNGW